MLSVPAAVATLLVVVVVVAVNMRYCLHGMHDNTLLRLPDKGRKVKARVSDRRDLPAAAWYCSLIRVLQLMQGSACCCCLLFALARDLCRCHAQLPTVSHEIANVCIKFFLVSA